MTDLTDLTHSHISQAVDDLLNGLGAGMVTEHRLRAALERLAHRVAADTENQVLLGLKTADELAEQFNVTPRRMRAIIRNRHKRWGSAWQVPGTNQWLVRPSEIESMRPDERYRRK